MLNKARRFAYWSALCLPCSWACSEAKSTTNSSNNSDASVEGPSNVDATTATGSSGDVAIEAGVSVSDGDGTLVFDPTRVANLAIQVSESDLAILRTDAEQPMNFEDFTYVPAKITYDGMVIENVGVRVKGNNSRASAVGNAVPFKLDTNRYVAEQKLDGQTKINLHNNVNQPALMNEFLSYAALREHGIAASRTGWVDVQLNGEALGTYTIVEQVGDKLLSRYYEDGDAPLYKPEPPSGYLTYSGDDFESYTTADYEGNAETDHATFLKLVKTLDQGAIDDWDDVVDIDSVLDYFATNVGLGNWDTYVAMGHNYYLFEATPGRMVMLPWDMNLSQAASQAVCPRDTQMGNIGGGAGFGGAPPEGETGIPAMGSSFPGGFPAASGMAPPEFAGADGGFLPPGFGGELVDGGVPGGFAAGGEAPLHDKLLSDPEYMARYLDRLGAFLEGAGSVAALHKNIDLGRVALGERVTDQAVEDIKKTVSQRVASIMQTREMTTSCSTSTEAAEGAPPQ